jgi:hypothetical protein
MGGERVGKEAEAEEMRNQLGARRTAVGAELTADRHPCT